MSAACCGAGDAAWIPAVVIAVSGIVGSLVAAFGYDRLFGKKEGGR